MRNRYWTPEYTKLKPSFNDMGAMQLNLDHPLNRGLALRLLINEGGGSNLYDLSGLRNHAVMTNPVWQKANNGPAMGFDGSTTRGHIADSPSIQLVSEFTILITLSRAIAQNDRRVLEFNGVGSGYCGWMIYTTGGQVRVYATSAGTSWNVVANRLVVDLTNANTIYKGCVRCHGIDWDFNELSGGKVIQNDAAASISGLPPWSGNGYGLEIGRWGPGADQYFNGTIYDVAIYNRYLSNEELSYFDLNPYGTPDSPLFLVTPRRSWLPSAIIPTTAPPTTILPTTLAPTLPPTTIAPTAAPTTIIPPTTEAPTAAPTTLVPTQPPTTEAPTTLAPTVVPTTLAPTVLPTTLAPTVAPTTIKPTTEIPTTIAPTLPPTTLAPTTIVLPTTPTPTTTVPTTLLSTISATSFAPTTAIPSITCIKYFDSEIDLTLCFDSPIINPVIKGSPIAREIRRDGHLCW